MARSSMPGPRVPLVDQDGRISSEWYRWLAAKEKDASAAATGEVLAGAGLAGGGVVSEGVTLRIGTAGVTNAMLRDSLATSVIGRFQGTGGQPADIQATVDNRVLGRFGGILAFKDIGAIGATVADGDYGDITVSGSGATFTIDNDVVSNAKLANVATATFKGRTTAGTGDPEDLTATQATALLDVFTTSLKGLVPSGGSALTVLRGDATWQTFSDVLFDHYTTVGNGTTVETDLYSDTIAAGQLASNGDKLAAFYGGNYVSSATATRQIKIYFAGSIIFNTGALTLSLSSAWTAYVDIIRVSSSVVRYMFSFTTEGAALAAYTAVGELTGLTLANTAVLKITGQAAGVGAASNDIVAKIGGVSFHPAA